MITVIQPGTFTTVQDLRRVGFQSAGVPECGAVDKFSMRCANLLVGNLEWEPVLEITLFGPQITFDNPAIVAVTGANLSPILDGESVENWTSFSVPAGGILSFGGPVTGARSYLSFAGGIRSSPVAEVMGSYSTYVPGGFGGFGGRPLKAGDELEIGEANLNEFKQREFPSHPQFSEDALLRVLLGPQDHLFTDDSIQLISSSDYQVSVDSDRMGIRLEGAPLTHLNSPDVVSDGTAFGTIQVPGSGLPIILSADRGTTGGYPKIATVISADHSKLGQLIPGNTVRFSVVSRKLALKALRQQERMLDSLRDLPTISSVVKVSGKIIDVVDETGQMVPLDGSGYRFNASVRHSEHVENVEIKIED